MARLLDLPDELLTLIFQHFEAVQQSPHLLRAAEAKKGAAGRRKLLLLARVCKRLHRIATALLHRNLWLNIDLSSGFEDSPSYPRDQFATLARLTACKNFQHLVCEIDPGSIDPFLACLNNVTSLSGIRSLSLSIDSEPEGDGVEYIDLQCLSGLSNIVGLEVDMRYYQYNTHDIEVPSALPSLKQLVCGSNTFSQLVTLLSLACPESLEDLNITWSMNGEYQYHDQEDIEAMGDMWKMSWNNEPARALRRLSILCDRGSDIELPTGLLAGVPTYFPGLNSFDISYQHALSSERYLTLISDHSICTSLTISPTTTEELELALSSFIEGAQHHGKLQSVRIETKSITSEDHYTSSGFAKLWKQAFAAARSCGVRLSRRKVTKTAAGKRKS